MDFGKKLYCGNFVVTKKSRSLSKHELKELRDKEGIREDVRKHLTRGSLPYICVETVGGGWKVEFGIGTTMFEAIDALGMADFITCDHSALTFKSGIGNIKYIGYLYRHVR